MQRGNTPELTVRTPSRPVSASGRAEWVKFAAAFFNKEAEANLVFKRTAARFDAVAAAVAAARARGEPSRASATHLSATPLDHISRQHSASCLGPGSALSLGRRRTLAARRLRHSRARDGVGDGGVVLPTRCCRAAAEHGPTYQHVLKARYLAASQS